MREAVVQIPLLLRKPGLLRLCFLTARRAHIGFAIVLVLLTLVAPPVVSRLADSVYPKKLIATPVFQFVKSYRRVSNPEGDRWYIQLLIGAWAIGLGVVAGLYIRNIPNGVDLGKQRAEFLITKAARLSETDPQGSADYRRMADTLLLDNQQVTKLDEPMIRTMPIAGVKAREATYIGPHGRYRLDRVIRAGGMGIVHAGYDTVLQRLIAIKQLFRQVVRDSQQVGRFRREALALAKLSHNHIVPIYDLFEDDQSFWIVMELLTGGSLDDRIRDKGILDIAESVEITCCIAEALGFVHSKDIIHRDVKPMNILIAANGAPKLTDFGNVKLAQSSFHTHEGLIVGSPGYLSPEQATGEEIDHRSDIYSLGISLYQMVAGKIPFEGETSAILAQHITRTPRPPRELNADIPVALDQVILKMLEKNPKRRFQKTDDLIAALRQLMPEVEEQVTA